LNNDRFNFIVELLQVRESLEFTVFFECQGVTKFFNGANENVLTDITQLKNILLSVQNSFKCKGVAGYQNVTSYPCGSKSSTGWISTKCDQVTTHQICVPCKLMIEGLSRRSLRVKSRRLPVHHTHITPAAEQHKLKKVNRYYRRRVRVLQQQRSKLRNELMNV